MGNFVEVFSEDRDTDPYLAFMDTQKLAHAAASELAARRFPGKSRDATESRIYASRAMLYRVSTDEALTNQ